MAHSVSWATDTFEASPIVTDLIGLGYSQIQNTRKAVGERFRTEHEMADDQAITGNQGKHNMGSARVFYYDDGTAGGNGSLPATPTVAIADASDDYMKGRTALVRWPDPDEVGAYWYRLLIFKVDAEGSAWVEPSYAHLSEVAETFQGLKTFKTRPRATDVTTAYDTANNADFLPKVTIEERFTSFLTVARDSIIPVGFIYAQMPGFPSPTVLWSWATWAPDTSEVPLDGSFLRIGGGEAGAYGAAQQAQQLPAHTHAIANVGSVLNPTADKNTPEGPDYQNSSGYSRYHFVTPTTVTGEAGVGTELRPINKTVKFWKRTA